MRNFKVFIVSILLLTASFLPQSAQAATIRSVYFSLSGWNGPLYTDFNAICSNSAGILTSPGAYWRGPLNGNWRVTLYELKPNVTYTLTFHCVDNNDGQGSYAWRYSVSYGNGKIYAKRVLTEWMFFPGI